MVFANRDVVAAIAGVFFLLPLLIAVIVLPPPALTSGMDGKAIADAFVRFNASSGPILLVMSLPMLVGYLTLLVMLLDRDRPTVGAAIKIGLRFLPSFYATQVLASLALYVLWEAVLSVLGLALPPIIALPIALVAMIYPQVRLVLIGPEMVTRRLLNPFGAIVAGLSRTRGHGLRITLYIGPALTLFLVVCVLVMIFVGLLATNVPQAEAQRMISLAFGSVLFALGYSYYAAIIASTYEQLGPVRGPGETISPSSPS